MSNLSTESVVIQEDQGSSLWQDAWIKLSKNRLALFGLAVLVSLIVISLLTPLIAPYGYEEQNLDMGATAPSLQHWLGTDIFGRDMLTRIMYGGRVSLMVGFIATAVALVIGILWGAIAGFYGGRLDAIMMRIVDVLYALPFMVFIILSLRNQEFVEAAHSLGLSQWTIIRRHLIPNTLGPVIVYTTLTIPSVMLLEAFLSFLGLGIQPPESSWGLLINYGVETMEEFPWLLIFPGIALSLTLFALNFLGDGLRDALDPRTSKD